MTEKRKTLELESKIAITNELENGQKQSFICKTRNLTKQTVSKIWDFMYIIYVKCFHVVFISVVKYLKENSFVCW